MRFVPIINLEPLMVIVMPGRVSTNELWTVKSINRENGTIQFVEHNYEFGISFDPTMTVPAVGVRPSLYSNKINYFHEPTITHYNKPVIDFDKVMADMQKDHKESIQDMLDEHLGFVVMLIKDGEDLNQWSAAEKMRETHERLGHLFLK
jgi:hypothetical protein